MADLFQPQLFLDDALIEDSTCVQRVWHQPRKVPQPVLTATEPWEVTGVLAYGTVLLHDGVFKMWYCTYSYHEYWPRVCYAESRDGLHWEKPSLGIHEFEGSRDNNIVLQSSHGPPYGYIDDLTVIHDSDDEEWPLKMLYWDGASGRPTGIWWARSRDGIHWESLPEPALPYWSDRFNAVAAKVDGKYLVFGRAARYLRNEISSFVEKGLRTVWRTESADGQEWSLPELVFAPDIEDAPTTQAYSLVPFRYGDLLLGGVERMYTVPDKLDTELVWSRDAGRNWQRSRARPPFIAWGEAGAWDDTWIALTANDPIEHAGGLWFYYSGRSTGHDLPHPFKHAAIGLAVLRKDGFASLQATEQPGVVVTRVLQWPDATLHVNCDPRRDLRSHPGFASGELRVEVRDEKNQVVPGFGWDDCISLRENTAKSQPTCSSTVAWQNGRTLRELQGQSIRLAFRLRDCHLYSFRAMEEKE
jgi:hypothetical protein